MMSNNEKRIVSPNLEFFSNFVGRKEYGSEGSQSLGNKNVDVSDILDRMWEENPELAIKNIFYKGDCRGGANEKRLFQVGMNWLVQRHPKWSNLSHIPEYRYWRDLVNVAIQNPSVRGQVVVLFADQLYKDREMLTENTSEVSLCAKWVPTEGCTEDLKDPYFLLSLRAVMGMTPREFRKGFITPLRAHLKIVERFMCANEWGQIDYSRVPSVAMQKYKETFKKHDSKRFSECDGKVVCDNISAKVNVQESFAHIIAAPYLRGGSKDDIIETQFKTLEDQVKKMGIFNRSLVISDTSSSMSGTPRNISIALGILISRCTAAPFTDFMINLASEPTFTKLSDKDLHLNVQTMSRLLWDGLPDIYTEFDKLFQKADEMKLTAEQMPNRLYILTDSQFDKIIAMISSGGALYDVWQKFTSRNYNVPEIVYWNLRGETAIASIPNSQKHMRIINGFSTSVLSTIMKGCSLEPYNIMFETLTGRRYKRLNFPGKIERNIMDHLIALASVDDKSI
jgi:hypothetical protein